MDIQTEIQKLKKEQNAIILAHYYVADEVQAIADYTGDSFYLSQIAQKAPETTIVFCGVEFMGESAKILSPKKTILLPAPSADCFMAHMATKEEVLKKRKEIEDLAVVCYINSTAELKTFADVCVTSSNAVKIVKALPNKNIFFIPDENLGRFVEKQCPEKTFYFNGGCCPVHARLNAKDVEKAKEIYPNAPFLAHPECREEVLKNADYIGSTKGIISFAKNSSSSEFIIGTEKGILYQLYKECPDKKFHLLTPSLLCTNMKKINLENVLAALQGETEPVYVPQQIAEQARKSLLKMLELGK